MDKTKHWAYRLVEKDGCIGISEVYYDEDNNPVGWTEPRDLADLSYGKNAAIQEIINDYEYRLEILKLRMVEDRIKWN